MDDAVQALTKQRDDVANKLIEFQIESQKLVEAVTEQRDTVAQKLIDTEIELDNAKSQVKELSKALATYQAAQGDIEATTIGKALIKLFQSFGYKK
jgi:hypothetical protein